MENIGWPSGNLGTCLKTSFIHNRCTSKRLRFYPGKLSNKKGSYSVMQIEDHFMKSLSLLGRKKSAYSFAFCSQYVETNNVRDGWSILPQLSVTWGQPQLSEIWINSNSGAINCSEIASIFCQQFQKLKWLTSTISRNWFCESTIE